MHELSVCEGLLKQVVAIARQHRAMQVTRIRLRIGPLSGVEPELLRQAYPLASAGSLAEAAELEIENQPVRIRCGRCQHESDARPNDLRCGACGDCHTRVVSGDALLLVSVELKQDQTPDANDRRQAD